MSISRADIERPARLTIGHIIQCAMTIWADGVGFMVGNPEAQPYVSDTQYDCRYTAIQGIDNWLCQSKDISVGDESQRNETDLSADLNLVHLRDGKPFYASSSLFRRNLVAFGRIASV